MSKSTILIHGKILLTILLLCAGAESIWAVASLLNVADDVVVIGGVVLAFLLFSALIACGYLIWKKEISNVIESVSATLRG